MKFYIATSLDNMPAHNELRDWLIAQGDEITYDWTTHGPAFTHGMEYLKKIAAKEIEGVQEADYVVMLWSGEAIKNSKGRGTHIEVGIALGLRKPVHIVSDIPEYHVCCRETCAFYHVPGVYLYKSLDELKSRYISDNQDID